MHAYLEVWASDGRRLVPLEGERITIGKDPDNDVGVPGDRTLSRLHAAFERYRTGWCVRDLGSQNGTFVNGERIMRERVLHAGDEVLVGRTRLVFQDEPREVTATEAAEGPPILTRRERDVLVELVRPVLSGDVFTEPASIRQIAKALVLSEATVKQHLTHLYDKFAVYGQDERRRVRLANEAVRRRAISLADIRTTPAT